MRISPRLSVRAVKTVPISAERCVCCRQNGGVSTAEKSVCLLPPVRDPRPRRTCVRDAGPVCAGRVVVVVVAARLRLVRRGLRSAAAGVVAGRGATLQGHGSRGTVGSAALRRACVPASAGAERRRSLSSLSHRGAASLSPSLSARPARRGVEGRRGAVRAKGRRGGRRIGPSPWTAFFRKDLAGQRKAPTPLAGRPESESGCEGPPGPPGTRSARHPTGKTRA